MCTAGSLEKHPHREEDPSGERGGSEDGASPTSVAAPQPDQDRIALQAPGASRHPPAPGTSHARITGLDAARAVAIIGMVAVHFGPTYGEPTDWLEGLYRLPHGRASLLFVLLAGIGMTLLAGHRDAERWRRAWPSLATRLIVLLPLGLALELLDVAVLVILQYYAVFFLLAAPALFLRDRLLLASAALLAVGGPLIYLLIQEVRPEWVDRAQGTALTHPPLEIARDLLLSGSYPAVVWMAPLLFGVWLGRRSLMATRTRLGMLLGGIAVTVVAAVVDALSPDNGVWRLADTTPHSQMIGWVVGSTGAATAAVAICLWLADGLGRIIWPLVAMGQLALTVYVAHLLLLAMAPSVFVQYEVGAALRIVGGFAAGAALGAGLWRLLFARGPLEALLHAPPAMVARLRSAADASVPRP